MPAPWTHRLTDPWPAEAGDPALELGGKGTGLLRLTSAGLPVPAGFVIRVSACAEYFSTNERWPEGLTEDIERELSRLKASMFAVRGGAAVSMPGMLETKLGVPTDAVRAAVETVLRSWLSDRATAYRKTHHLSLRGTAVVVQEMVPCECSGVAFSRDPLGGPGPRIEAVRGSGLSLVSGEMTPEASLSLGEDRTKELVELVRRVELLFRVPVDVEWGLSSGRFVLFQGRPIRSLELRAAAEVLEADESRRLADLARDRRRVWIAHNLGDTVFHPTPLEWDFWSRFMSGSGGLGTLFREIGYRPPPGGFLELILGRVYADAQKEADFSGFGVPLAIAPDALAKDPSTPSTTVDRTRIGIRDLWKLPLALWRLRRVSRNTGEPTERTVARFHFARVPFEAWVEHERGRLLTSFSVEELLELFETRRRRVFDEFGPEAVRPGFFCGLLLHKTKDFSVPAMQSLLPTRELARTAFQFGIDLIWSVVDELDRRWSANGGLRFLCLDELPAYPNDRLRFESLIGTRRMNREAARLIRLPSVIDSAKLDGRSLELPLPTVTSTVNALSQGSATGPVWVRDDGSTPPPRAVVVAETADPEMAKWFPVISAIVVERGGVLSHLAVLAREAGIPSVVCPDALRNFSDGELVSVDGSAGRVQKLSPRTQA